MYETNQDNARIRFTVRDAIFKIIFPFNVTIDSCMDFLKKQEAIRDNYCVKGFTYGVFLIHIFPHLDIQTEYGEILCISLHSVRIRENTAQTSNKAIFHAVKVIQSL